jgi:NADPH:quinone reductase-like Zn-dependent oxidoreductase
MAEMTAVVTADGTLTDASVPVPDLRPRDVLVRVAAVSVNPVDTKVRPGPSGRVLGYDAAGTVVATGPEVTRFSAGRCCGRSGTSWRSTTSTRTSTPLKSKSLTWHWEFMFARSSHQADDMDAQGALLDSAAALVDRGVLRTTATRRIEGITAATLTQAHRLAESGTVIGKIVLSR